MRPHQDDVQRLLTRELLRRAPHQRAEFLREVIATTAEALTAVVGRPAASEAVYRTADKVVANKDLA